MSTCASPLSQRRTFLACDFFPFSRYFVGEDKACNEALDGEVSIKMTRKTVVACFKLGVGFGNQMFIYAAALGLAVRQDRDLKIDLSAFEHNKDRPYKLDCLKIPQTLDNGPPLFESASRGLTARIVRKLCQKLGRTEHHGLYREPHFHFDPVFFNLSGAEVRLTGYFQSPRYFVGAESLLRERFQPMSPFTPTAADWATKITQSPCAVSVHLRRGDYCDSKNSTIHHLLDRGYYDRAMTLMQDLVGERAEFFFFSDEPDFVANTFANLPRVHIVHSDPTAPWEDLFLMAKCRHNIIANSSYSWWGAWLNTAQDKRVIAPAQWFTSNFLATCNVVDLYPEEWILLK